MDAPRLSSAVREEPQKDGTPGPYSFRRLGALYLFLLAPAVLVGSAFLAKSVLPKEAPPLVWIAMILGPFALCLILGALMPILTTSESIRGLIAAARGSSGQPAPAAQAPAAGEGP
jgi:hypothetical protein